jgi:hypothetical protein
MPRPHPTTADRCECMNKLRAPDDRRRHDKKFKYYRAQVRLCSEPAVALVQFAGVVKPRRCCDGHLLYELVERPADVAWAQEIPDSKRAVVLRPSKALDLANRLEKYRAPLGAVDGLSRLVGSRTDPMT